MDCIVAVLVVVKAQVVLLVSVDVPAEVEVQAAVEMRRKAIRCCLTEEQQLVKSTLKRCWSFRSHWKTGQSKSQLSRLNPRQNILVIFRHSGIKSLFMCPGTKTQK